MEYYIYGAGKNLNTVIEQASAFLNIKGILDNNTEKIGTFFYGILVESAHEFVKTKFDVSKHKIIVSVTQLSAKKEIEDMLEDNGLIKGENYFLASDFCLFAWEQLPGIVSGVIELPEGYKAKKSSDPNSFLVESDDKRLFRVVKPQATEKAKRIYNICKEYNLLGQYIVDSWLVDNMEYFSDRNEIVLEHKYISPITYCYEWAPEMYEEYVEFMLDFLVKLTQAGLKLGDPHGLNATVNAGRFIFLDFGAIDEGIALPNEIIELVNTLILPLILMQKNYFKKAYLYLEEHEITMNIRDIVGYLDQDEKNCIEELYEKLLYIRTRDDVIHSIENVRKFICGFDKVDKQNIWGDYQEDEWIRESNYKNWSTKMKSTIDMIRSIKPRSIVDIAGNQGWYGSYCRDIVERIVVVDMDTDALDKLWKRIKQNNMKNVTPMKMSICAPSLGRHYDGLIDGKSIKPLRECGCKRIKSEMAIALAIVHHLAFREHLSFDEIIKLLLSYTDKYLIVEFIEQTDVFISNFKKNDYQWYSKEGFETNLKKYCTILKQSKSTPEETRTLYLCEKL